MSEVVRPSRRVSRRGQKGVIPRFRWAAVDVTGDAIHDALARKDKVQLSLCETLKDLNLIEPGEEIPACFLKQAE